MYTNHHESIMILETLQGMGKIPLPMDSLVTTIIKQYHSTHDETGKLTDSAFMEDEPVFDGSKFKKMNENYTMFNYEGGK